MEALHGAHLTGFALRNRGLTVHAAPANCEGRFGIRAIFKGTHNTTLPARG